MPRPDRLALALSAVLLSSASCIAQAAGFDDWPTKYSFGNGTELSATGNFAYDVVDFSGDRGYGTVATALGDDGHYRRREFGIGLKKKDVYDFTAVMDFESKLWLDVALRLETKALFGADYGKLRVGYFKTPVSMESVAASRTGSMMELSAASQAMFQGRRTGVEWSLERPRYAVSTAYFFGHDLQGDNPGTTAAARAVWTPVKDKNRVVHLGLTGSVENPHGFRDGRGAYFGPSARFRARPENGLTPVRLVDSGSLRNTDRIVRNGLEALWIDGPWSVQAEYLRASAERENGARDFTAHGYYVTGSWVLTGESRPYSNNNVANIKPTHGYGAVELLARYGELDLDDGGIAGGRQRDLTLGVNWYLTTHFKFQANYVRMSADKGVLSADPDVLELRAQVHF
ncbi:OprO/OprP family phosphate-selective porin [Lysobacter antibioticus]|uniref:OprO/OprP family phosphate-selective porin n=1 Tax=Lysobacter antibioticus TaxID=84531 RepID=UPI0004D01425|nr:porin [Lysobacter antibioticus]